MRTKMRPALRRQLDRVNDAAARIDAYEADAKPDASPERRHAEWVSSQWDRATVEVFLSGLARAVRDGAGVPPRRKRRAARLVYSKGPAQ